jgi:hypothetical protein
MVTPSETEWMVGGINIHGAIQKASLVEIERKDSA